jgi:hypothetical protein
MLALGGVRFVVDCILKTVADKYKNISSLSPDGQVLVINSFCTILKIGVEVSGHTLKINFELKKDNLDNLERRENLDNLLDFRTVQVVLPCLPKPTVHLIHSTISDMQKPMLEDFRKVMLSIERKVFIERKVLLKRPPHL